MILCPLDFRYGRDEMKTIFSESERLLYQLRVEAALAMAHAKAGTIHLAEAEEIAFKADLEHVSMERVKEIEKETRHDVMAMVKALTEQCGEAGRYVHLGATSNDIVDTATALQVREALNIVLADVKRLMATFASLARKHRDTIEVGRTHAQFAIPITFGFKIAGYLAEMTRYHQRIEQVLPRACVGKMAGAVGSGAALGESFFEIQEEVMNGLGLSPEPAATQVVGRDRYTELICLLAQICTSCERYATEVRNLQRSELDEAAESFDVTKQVGSSTMAHKRNPIVSENVCGLARVVRGFLIPTFESQVLWHERDLTNSSAERFILPHVFTLTDDILCKMIDVFSHLSVKRENMLRNIESANGLIMAEPVMMALTTKGMGRQQAHEIVRECSMAAAAEGRHLKEALMGSRGITDLLSEEEIDSAMDPANYVGKAPEMVDRVIAEAENVLGRKL